MALRCPAFAHVLILSLFAAWSTVAQRPGPLCFHHDTEDVVEWVRLHGGFVDPRLRIESGLEDRGFVTTGPISSGEELIRMPSQLMITDGHSPCDTVRRLRNELSKGHCSKFWPYLKPLGAVTIDIPDAWTADERAALSGLPPGDWQLHTTRLQKDCSKHHVPFELDDPVTVQALFLYITKAGPLGMQPLYDIFNHGYNSTNHTIADRDGTHVFQAARDIEADGELFNQLRPGAGAGAEVVQAMMQAGEEPEGAPEFLRDFGLVEKPPALWWFERDGRRHSFILEDGAGHVSWLRPFGTVSQLVNALKHFEEDAQGLLAESINWRAQQVASGSSTRNSSRRPELATTYRNAFEFALRSAIAAATRQERARSGEEL